MTDTTPPDSIWDAPESTVLATVGRVLEREDRGVLATVTAVEGNAYRRPGAKMLLPESGEGVGHVTAGCLEGEIQQLAADILETGEPRLETFDLTPGEDDVWGLGVGCSGVIDLLLEPIGDVHHPIVEAVDAGRDVGFCTVLEGDRAGARADYDPAADRIRTDDAVLEDRAERLTDVAADFVANGRSDTVRIDGTEIFVDGITAPPSLLVVGSGHDVGPIAGLGDYLGFDVTVVAYRGAEATDERFPAADRVLSTSPARLLDAVDVDDRTYAVVATHNVVDDRLTVGELLDSSVPYIGLMGPHERFERIRDAFEEAGRTLSDAERDRIYTPVGLDVGGGSPREIALSVASEVQAVRYGREPRHLRERDGAIHDRSENEVDS